MTVLFVALFGVTAAVSVPLSPSVRVRVEELRLTPVTATVVGVGVGSIGSSFGSQPVKSKIVMAIMERVIRVLEIIVFMVRYAVN